MALIEYLLWKFKKTPQQIETAPQGDNKEKIAELQAQMDELQRALDGVMGLFFFSFVCDVSINF